MTSSDRFLGEHIAEKIKVVLEGKKNCEKTLKQLEERFKGKKKPSWYPTAMKGGWNPYDSVD